MDRDREFQRQLRRIEELIAQIENGKDSSLKASAQELVCLVNDFHGAAIDRMMELISQAGEAGLAIIDKLGSDSRVASLLLLHGLHPIDFETRVRQALNKVRPYLQSHGGNVDLVSVRDGEV